MVPIFTILVMLPYALLYVMLNRYWRHIAPLRISITARYYAALLGAAMVQQ